MLGYVKITRDDEDKKTKNYYCAQCGAFISHSAALVAINGSTDHSYVNPAGIRCNFLTFAYCENILEHLDLFLEYSWFPGYGWRFLTCSSCFSHLGWKYDAVKEEASPEYFFGVLTELIQAVEEEQ